MGDRSAIEWTDATWNPVTGCSRVSPGCEHCYAEALSLRRGWSERPWTAQNAEANVVLHPERLEQPIRWRKPRRVFINSMSDLFHGFVPDWFLDHVFAVIMCSQRHTYQVLTKRPDRMREYFRNILKRNSARQWDDAAVALGLPFTDTSPAWPLENAWLGTSVEDQRRADERIPALLDVPAAVRFLSVEPLLGPVSLRRWLAGGRLHWVIVGGESGPGFRPMVLWWVQALRDECVEAGVPFFFKQWGGRTPKAGGRELDGRTWDEFPMTRDRNGC